MTIEKKRENIPPQNIPNCEKCKGTGKINLTEKELKERENVLKKLGIKLNKIDFKPCDCINPEYQDYQKNIILLNKYISIYKKMNITDKYKNFCFDMYKLKILNPIFELCEKKYFINKQNKKKSGFLFWSYGPGTGKTLLSLSILNSLCVDFKIYGRFENTTFLWNTLKKFYNIDREKKYYSELDYLDMLANIDVLVLDDIGSEKISDWIKEQLYFIFEARNIENKITIITSNHSPNDMVRKLGDKIVSRMLEYTEAIEFEGKDWRQK
jgi:DNA replication protein DnaC